MKVNVYEKVISCKNPVYELNTTGILNKNTLKFMEDNTKVIINFSDTYVNIKKEDASKLLVFDLNLKKSSAYYILKHENIKSNLDIKLNSISCNKQEIKLDYDLENIDNFKININMCNK